MMRIGSAQFKTRLPLSAWILFAFVTLFSFLDSSLDRPMAGLDREHSGHSVWYGLGGIPTAAMDELIENVLHSMCAYAANALSAAI